MVVVVVLQGEDDIVVSIVVSLIMDLTGVGRSLASYSGHLLFILPHRHFLLRHPLISLFRQFLSLRLTMKSFFNYKPTNPLLQHHMLPRHVQVSY